MTHLEATNSIHELMILCNKVIVNTTIGADAEYASAVGNACKDALLTLNELSESELAKIVDNVDAYKSILNSLLV